MKGIQRNLYPGGNTPQGFYSYYNYILTQKKAEKIFCIKGGPGVGKSTLMKQIGEYFFNKGENVDYLWCSSDADSIDGVLMRERNVAIIDATSPHIVDPVTPGAVDEIINLGTFWDEYELRKNKKSIMCSSEIIKSFFGMAYCYLLCASVHYDFMTDNLSHLIDDNMLCETVDSINSSFCEIRKRGSESGKRKKLFASAITPGGLKNGFESMVQNIDNIVILEVPVGFRTETVMKPIADTFVRSGFEIEEFYCPMDPEKKLEHIIVPSVKTAFLSSNKFHMVADLNYTSKYKIAVDRKNNELIYDIYSEQLDAAENDIMSAVRMLKCAKAQHDVLEKYYIDAMDFSKIADLKNRIIDNIEML